MTKRFYTEAAVIALEDGASGVALDGRSIRTPAGAALALPLPALAEAVAAEWAAQEGTVRPLSMPMMRLAATAIDRVGRERAAVVAQIAACGAHDLLCYRAGAPEPLVRRQAETWQPLLDWCARTCGARLAVTEGVTHVEQPQEALAALTATVDAMDDFRLAALSQLTAACGSLVLALAVCAGRTDAAGAIAASQLDEAWQAENWGSDAEAETRRANLAREITDAVRFLELLDRRTAGDRRAARAL
ncbi:MAG: ATPase [Alphaproteobacteria bacterium]|nr:ATPase [Alphaproteobacteria bacterium]